MFLRIDLPQEVAIGSMESAHPPVGVHEKDAISIDSGSGSWPIIETKSIPILRRMGGLPNLFSGIQCDAIQVQVPSQAMIEEDVVVFDDRPTEPTAHFKTP